MRLTTSIGGPGARIAIATENRPEIVELMFAIWAAQCAAVPINFKLHPREMVQILDDSHRLASAPSDPPRTTDTSTLAWLFYTSGTTGQSKGAMLSHRNLMAMTVAHLADFDAPDENCSLVHGAPMTITCLRRADRLGADDAILGSVGYARSGVDVRVLRDDGAPAAIGEIGEIGEIGVPR